MTKTIIEYVNDYGVTLRLKQLGDFYYLETETERSIHRSHNYKHFADVEFHFNECKKALS